MNRIPKARYTKEVREEAVKLAEAVGASEASRWLSIPLKTLANWLRASMAGKLAEVGQHEKLQMELEAKLHRVKRERLQKDLADYGVAVGVHRIKRLRSKLGLRCKQKRKFKATTGHSNANRDIRKCSHAPLHFTRAFRDIREASTAQSTDCGWRRGWHRCHHQPVPRLPACA
jgi:transposase-like protein